MYKIKFYEHLPDEAVYIRTKVFVEEQGFNEEFDSTDKTAVQLLIFRNGTAIGTARMFTDNGGKSYHIGRVAVLKEYRGLHLGSLIVNSLCDKAKSLGAKYCELSAQCRVKEFYKSLGFSESGDVYLDEHCPHIHMEKTL